MTDNYLEVTFRHGQVVAAYFYLPRQSGDACVRSEPVEPGLVVDYASDNRPIGIEIVSPSRVSLQTFNQLLGRLGQSPVESRDLAPLHAA